MHRLGGRHLTFARPCEALNRARNMLRQQSGRRGAPAQKRLFTGSHQRAHARHLQPTGQLRSGHVGSCRTRRIAVHTESSASLAWAAETANAAKGATQQSCHPRRHRHCRRRHRLLCGRLDHHPSRGRLRRRSRSHHPSRGHSQSEGESSLLLRRRHHPRCLRRSRKEGPPRDACWPRSYVGAPLRAHAACSSASRSASAPRLWPSRSSA